MPGSSQFYLTQFYLWLVALVLMAMFLIYVFVYQHQIGLEEGDAWEEAFDRIQVPVDHISRDTDVWYHQGQSTCVGAGNFTDSCSGTEVYCSGGLVYGMADQQAREVLKALKNGGVHPECPLL